MPSGSGNSWWATSICQDPLMNLFPGLSRSSNLAFHTVSFTWSIQTSPKCINIQDKYIRHVLLKDVMWQEYILAEKRFPILIHKHCVLAGMPAVHGVTGGFCVNILDPRWTWAPLAFHKIWAGHSPRIAFYKIFKNQWRRTAEDDKAEGN